MKKKEMKNIAQRIANAEYTIRTSSDSEEIREAKEEIMKQSNRITSTDDMLAIDEMIKEFLSEKE